MSVCGPRKLQTNKNLEILITATYTRQYFHETKHNFLFAIPHYCVNTCTCMLNIKNVSIIPTPLKMKTKISILWWRKCKFISFWIGTIIFDVVKFNSLECLLIYSLNDQFHPHFIMCPLLFCNNRPYNEFYWFHLFNFLVDNVLIFT